MDNEIIFQQNKLIFERVTRNYRVDLSITEGDRVVFASAQMYFSISDHRLEVVQNWFKKE